MRSLAIRRPHRSSKASEQRRKGSGLDKVSYLGVGFLAGLLVNLVQPSQPTGQARRRTALERPRDVADSPLDISARGWRAVLQRSVKEFNEDHIPAVAAGAAFYSLLALFPALAVFVSLYGLFADVHGARAQIVELRGFLPEGGVTVLTQQIDRLAALPAHNLGLTFVVSLLLSVWSANAGMKALIAGLNVAYEERERRKFIALNLQSLAFTASAIAFAILAAMAVAATPTVLEMLRLGRCSR